MTSRILKIVCGHLAETLFKEFEDKFAKLRDIYPESYGSVFDDFFTKTNERRNTFFDTLKFTNDERERFPTEGMRRREKLIYKQLGSTVAKQLLDNGVEQEEVKQLGSTMAKQLLDNGVMDVDHKQLGSTMAKQLLDNGVMDVDHKQLGSTMAKQLLDNGVMDVDHKQLGSTMAKQLLDNGVMDVDHKQLGSTMAKKLLDNGVMDVDHKQSQEEAIQSYMDILKRHGKQNVKILKKAGLYLDYQGNDTYNIINMKDGQVVRVFTRWL